jgi:hypothetical protein
MDEIRRVLGQRLGDLAPAAAGATSDRSVSSVSYKHAMYFIRKAKVQDLLRRSGMSLICTEEWETGDVHDVLYYSKKIGATL